ncbi:uncharacterized protein LOC131858877 [Cryptomeria japonica]|uniref:uncharacterized protein LOC131858877 n=1 Tax=Cryptomeria japonica TaxID=3369 RepID=UPI0027D9D7AB|nr:uncharacterized protein LOC131858877 [Cryptomeria japonica]
MAGKIVLIKSVLNAVPTYLMSNLKAPKEVVVSLQDTLRSFLWNNNRDGKSRIPLLAWDKVCLPKELGGSGIRNLENQNLALGAKLVWKLYDNPASLWARIMFAKYLSNGDRESVFRAESLPKGSAIWNFMWKSIDFLPISSSLKEDFYSTLRNRIIILSELDDELIWTKNSTGKYSVKDGYNSLIMGKDLSSWPYKLFWHPACLPKAGAFTWLVVQDRVLTRMRLDRMGLSVVFPFSKGMAFKNKRIVATWVPPPSGHYKLHFDGASKGNPGMAGAGMAILDHKAVLILAQCHALGSQLNNFVECQALSLGIDMAISLGIKHLHIQGDSMLNKLADFLANLAIDLAVFHKIVERDDIPHDVLPEYMPLPKY